MAAELRRTPLHAAHVRLGARFVLFAGWEIPVQYAGIIAEHRAVRERAGLFDVSHMGEVIVEGPEALAALQRLVTNDVGSLEIGHGLYTPMCTPAGGIVDDLILFRIAAEQYLLVVNAATTAKDVAWIRDHAGSATVRDISSEIALLALQGPAAGRILARVTTARIDEMRPFDALPAVLVAGRTVFLSRTGYTGEDGYEIGPAWDDAPGVWDALMEAGAAAGLVPVGLGARDTLRLEAGLLLYGSDIDERTSPLEAPLGWTVKFEKGDFIGRAALLRQRASGPARRLAGLIAEARAVPRHGYVLQSEGRPVGTVTSGAFSPTLQTGIGLGYLPRELTEPGMVVAMAVRGRAVPIRVTRLPFYQARH